MKVEREYKHIMHNISQLMREEGYENKQVEICSELSKLTQNNIANRAFLSAALRDPINRQVISAQSFLVYRCEEFAARLNLWYPDSQLVNKENLEQLRRYFSLGVCHNHNFDFFTIGLLGPGYKTEILVTSQDISNTQVSDKIVFDKKYDYQLKKGNVPFFPKDTHFHTQWAPEKFSLSLNILPTVAITTKQFVLGDDGKTVTRVFNSR